MPRVSAFLILLFSFFFSPVAGAVVADFDWSVPPRFGSDADGDGLIDYRNTYDSIQAPAEGWRVDFDACGSYADKGIAGFEWSVDGDVADFIQLNPASPCVFSYRFPVEKQYTVALTVTDHFGGSHTADEIVVVQDWLIVAVGDSFGSGEGNPDIPLAPGAWEAFAAAKDAERTLWAAYQRALEDADEIAAQGNHVLDTLLPNWFSSEINALQDCACNFRHAFACIPFTEDHQTFCEPALAASAAARNALVAALFDMGITGLDAVEGQVTALLDAAEAAVEVARNLWEDALVPLGELEPKWQDRRCHRSAVSGQAKAALAIENSDPRTSVTFVHLACSGAKIKDLEGDQGEGGLLTPYKGIEPIGKEELGRDNWLPPQMDQLEDLVGDREVDALLISIGGNDVNFAPIIISCIGNQPCNDEVSYPEVYADPLADYWEGLLCLDFLTSPSVYEECSSVFRHIPENAIYLFDSTIGDLPNRYQQLDEKIQDIGISPGRVYLTEYPNATLDDDGSYCGFFEEYSEIDPLDAPLATYQRMLPLVTLDEAIWADTYVSRTLNEHVADAADEMGWNLVSGIYDAYGQAGEFGHGYCAADRYFVRLAFETFLKQMNTDGAVHPNAEGHDVYREKIAMALEVDFYTEDGARLPEQPPFCGNCHMGDDLITTNRRPKANAGLDKIVEQANTALTLVPMDGSGSSDKEGAALTYAWEWDGGTASGVAPEILLPSGETNVTLTVSDGHLSDSDTCLVTVIDKAPPTVALAVPQPHTALQGIVQFQARAADISGVSKVYFYLRHPEGLAGVPMEPNAYEHLVGTYDESTGEWSYQIDTTQVADGYYVASAKAVDEHGNARWSEISPISIRNWAIAELLPASEVNRARRTMPVKFSLHIDADIDPDTPFVYNENLVIRIYAETRPDTILQTSYFGQHATDYRINTETDVYIANFKTAKKAATYVVEIAKLGEDWLVGSFSFTTVP